MTRHTLTAQTLLLVYRRHNSAYRVSALVTYSWITDTLNTTIQMLEWGNNPVYLI